MTKLSNGDILYVNYIFPKIIQYHQQILCNTSKFFADNFYLKESKKTFQFLFALYSKTCLYKAKMIHISICLTYSTLLTHPLPIPPLNGKRTFD